MFGLVIECSTVNYLTQEVSKFRLCWLLSQLFVLEVFVPTVNELGNFS